MNKQKIPLGWSLFLNLCTIAAKEKKLDELFDLFMTPEEKEQFCSRSLIIANLLKNELTQREIADHFNVSISQITRGSNALKRADERLLKKLIPILQDSL